MLLTLAAIVLFQTPVQSLPLPIPTPARGYAIWGKLAFESHVLPVSMEVSLEVDDGRSVRRTMSLPNGEFRFNELAYGRYFIVIEGEKFWSVREQVTIDQGVFDEVRVAVSLKARPGMVAAAGATVAFETLRREPAPKEAQKEFERALEARRRRQSKNAIEHLQKALKIAPNYYEAALELGFEQHRAGRSNEAIQSLEKAVELDPASVMARRALGKMYFEKLEYRKAADTLLPLTKIASSDPEIYTLLGATFYKLDLLSEAEEYLRHAVSLEPELSGPAHLQLFNVYIKSNRLPLALAHAEAYLKLFPNDANIQGQVAKLRDVLKRRLQ